MPHLNNLLTADAPAIFCTFLELKPCQQQRAKTPEGAHSTPVLAEISCQSTYTTAPGNSPPNDILLARVHGLPVKRRVGCQYVFVTSAVRPFWLFSYPASWALAWFEIAIPLVDASAATSSIGRTAHHRRSHASSKTSLSSPWKAILDKNLDRSSGLGWPR